jgi:SAM-dependent methyltransferase
LKIAIIPENVAERIGLKLGFIPWPLGDVFLGPLLARTVLAASFLGVFDLLAHGPRTVEQVAAKCGNHTTATSKLLRALYASGYLKWRNGRYGLTRISKRWLPSRSPESIHFAILHRAIDFRFMDFERYVRTGEARDFHQELGEEEWVRYHRGQASQARLILQEVVHRIPVPAGASKMLDLGGHGLYSLALCERYPDLHSTVLDLATPRLQETSMADSGADARVRFQKADILTAPLDAESADLVLLANVIHHFDKSANRRLFHRVAGALRPGGFLVVVDLMRAGSISESHQIEALMDLYFGAASGSQLWTVTEIQSWQQKAGLQSLSPVELRLLADCKIQSARKPMNHRKSGR